MSNKLLLIVMDGWGLYKDYPGNAVAQAHTPTFSRLWQDFPAATLEASGLSVGLPEGQMGTSEVNHLTIGAGRVIYQDLVRINQSIENHTLKDNPAFVNAFNHVKQHRSTLHLLGLVSPGGVHSHQDHFVALAQAAKEQGITQLVIHAFTDGRDTPTKNGAEYLQKVQDELDHLEIGRIGSIIGRYFAMDRDTNWDRTQKALDLLLQGKGESHQSVSAAMHAAYTANLTDEFLEPMVISPNFTAIQPTDAVIFVNFRNDRTRQLTQKILEQQLNQFYFATMTQYHPDYPVSIAFAPQSVEQSLGEVISNAGLNQYRITETEKFAHMTFFINCKREAPFPGEDRQMYPSNSDIPTHDLKPEMRAADIAQDIVNTIKASKHEVIFTNLCNPDMVGHTGNIPAAIKACEAVDAALAQIIPVAQDHGFSIILTADHGNADEMLNEETGEPITSHSLNPVPCVIISPQVAKLNRQHGTLIDIAPTALTLLGLPIPSAMTGASLI